MKLYCGVDLHSTNGYYAIMDQNGKRVKGKRLPNDPDEVVRFLEKYKEDLVGVAIEAMGWWYWLADLLQDNDYNVLLANPAAIEQYDGLKNANDKSDAFFVAQLYQLDTLPTGYIMPREDRSIRDLLRRRMHFVRLRTSLVSSLLALIGRETGQNYGWSTVGKLGIDEFKELFDHDQLLLFTALEQFVAIKQLSERVLEVEQVVENKVKLKPEFAKLKTIPGIGKILALTIMLETGEISRFEKCGKYSSYCRCVPARHTSNKKKKKNKNRKNGNKYLAWAYVEAAQFCRRWCDGAKRFYNRKVSQTNNPALATKSLACKLSKAAYYIMRDQVDFDESKIFS